MDRGIWALWYDVPQAARPEYLALFGALTVHTFLDPSPAQLAQRQSPETRRMIGLRQQVYSCIFAEETRVDGPDVARRGPGMTPGLTE
jgi:hypothetical protein